MKNSETGEFEMTVGSRHLLSGFFIVLVLVGVSFAMGYVVGQNTGSVKVDAPSRPAAPASRPQPASVPLEPARELNPEPKGGLTPAQATAEPSEKKAAAAPAAPAEQPAPPSPNQQAEPAPGTYWQVKAMRKSGAEVMVQDLKEKGLPAVMSPVPAKPGMMRVLVGPYSDNETMRRAKAQLEKAGLRPIPNHLK